MSEFYTIKEAADLLGVSPFTLRRYIKKGNLEAYAIGDGWRIKKDDLEKFVSNSKVKFKGE